MEREKVLSADERGVLDLEAVAAFWNSDVGQRIRQAGGECETRAAVHGEIQPGRNCRKLPEQNPKPDLEKEFVVVQGVADLVVLLPDEIWLVDFKTDEVRQDELAEKIKIYSPQLKLYAKRTGENLFAASHQLLAAFFIGAENGGC